ncbi:Hypothetical protein SRAE_2000049500 [Strongyloides ratti]|uniref:SR00449 n=1 Tax=Strongyloides ratti TaxID=34506 RepID=I1XAZ5_STRRB|nr:Hypothetical protein SRAE_2000049500 [Strongyloides ratti]AFI80883.1 SR00449 [Strongyloides ratti]CEF65820.1 Hypothetical protein SRAE_2000049500 [Strongyloides ratti]
MKTATRVNFVLLTFFLLLLTLPSYGGYIRRRVDNRHGDVKDNQEAVYSKDVNTVGAAAESKHESDATDYGTVLDFPHLLYGNEDSDYTTIYVIKKKASLGEKVSGDNEALSVAGRHQKDRRVVFSAGEGRHHDRDNRKFKAKPEKNVWPLYHHNKVEALGAREDYQEDGKKIQTVEEKPTSYVTEVVTDAEEVHGNSYELSDPNVWEYHQVVEGDKPVVSGEHQVSEQDKYLYSDHGLSVSDVEEVQHFNDTEVSAGNSSVSTADEVSNNVGVLSIEEMTSSNSENTVVDGEVNSNLVSNGEEVTSTETGLITAEEGSGVDVTTSDVDETTTADLVVSGDEGVSGDGMDLTPTEEGVPTINIKFANDLGVHILTEPSEVFQGGSEGYLGKLKRRKHHYGHQFDRVRHDDWSEEDSKERRRPMGDNDSNECDDDDDDDDECRRRYGKLDQGRRRNSGDKRDYSHEERDRRFYASGRPVTPRRSRRDVGNTVVEGISNTADSVATGVEDTVDAAVDKKVDQDKPKKSKASGIGSAIVGGISNTANSVATGIKNTVDAAVNSTTPKPSEKNVTSSTSACKSQDVCYSDSDCNGGKCMGVFVGTCNCNACFNFMTCTDDGGCGGLKGACDTVTKRCNCQEAHRKLGYANYFDTLKNFCNHKTCNGTSDSCNGLPCSAGRCFC